MFNNCSLFDVYFASWNTTAGDLKRKASPPTNEICTSSVQVGV